MTTPPEPVDAPAPAIRPPNPEPYSGPPGHSGPPGPVPPQPTYGPPQAGFALPHGAAAPPAGYAAPQAGYTAPQAAYGPPPGYFPPQVPVSPSGHRLAEFSDRLLARLIDAAIVGGVGLVLIAPIYIYLIFSLLRSIPTETTINGKVVSPQFDPTAFFLQFFALIVGALVIGLVINYLYQVEMAFRSGQTIGKRVMKIRVAPVDPARPLTRGMAAKRFVAEYGCNLVPGLSWVDGLWQLWDQPWRQCLHDKFAQTLVIKLNP